MLVTITMLIGLYLLTFDYCITSFPLEDCSEFGNFVITLIISILVDSAQKCYITLYLQIVTRGIYCQCRNKRSEIPFIQIIQAFI
jgi:hypothetical protein